MFHEMKILNKNQIDEFKKIINELKKEYKIFKIENIIIEIFEYENYLIIKTNEFSVFYDILKKMLENDILLEI